MERDLEKARVQRGCNGEGGSNGEKVKELDGEGRPVANTSIEMGSQFRGIFVERGSRSRAISVESGSGWRGPPRRVGEGPLKEVGIDWEGTPGRALRWECEGVWGIKRTLKRTRRPRRQGIQT